MSEMPNAVGLLRGLKIQKAEMVYDYLQLWFDNGVGLNIFNVFTVTGGCVADNLSQLVGCEVCSVDISYIAVRIVLATGAKSIRVGMSDCDYHGPEAMEYIGTGGERIVWQ